MKHEEHGTVAELMMEQVEYPNININITINIIIIIITIGIIIITIVIVIVSILTMEQVEFSNVVILNKTDLVTEEKQQDILDRISILNPRYSGYTI